MGPAGGSVAAAAKAPVGTEAFFFFFFLPRNFAGASRETLRVRRTDRGSRAAPGTPSFPSHFPCRTRVPEGRGSGEGEHLLSRPPIRLLVSWRFGHRGTVLRGDSAWGWGGDGIVYFSFLRSCERNTRASFPGSLIQECLSSPGFLNATDIFVKALGNYHHSVAYA